MHGWKVATVVALVVSMIAVMYRLLIANDNSELAGGGKIYVGETTSEVFIDARASLQPEPINRFFRFLAFVCIGFAINALIQASGQEQALWTKTATERLTLLVAFILFGLNYRQRVAANPGRWIEQLTLFGIGPRRTIKLSPEAKVRYVSLTRLEKVDKDGPRQPVTHRALELVDGNRVFPVNYSANDESALALAQSLQLRGYERVVVDQIGNLEPPEGLTQVRRFPKEWLVRPWLFPIVLLFLSIAGLPYLYERSIEHEHARTYFVEDYLTLARTADREKEGQLEEALAIYTTMLAESPEAHSALLGQGRVLLALGRYEQAVAKFEEYRLLEPERWLRQHNYSSSGTPWPPPENLATAYRSVGRSRTALWILKNTNATALRITLHADLEEWAEAEEIISKLDESRVEELAAVIQRVKERRPDPDFKAVKEEVPAEL